MSIEAMKQAVEAFEAIKKYVTDDGAMPENWDAYHEKEYFALEALRQAIEQAEKQEHQFKYTPYGLRADESGKLSIGELPRKEWVGLTDEEINDFDKKLRDHNDYCSLHFAWGISAKLKEKNGG
jgi:hypothetical protein